MLITQAAKWIKCSSVTVKAKEIAEWRKVNDIRIGDDKKNKKKKQKRQG